ncbi:hypothetical protein [Paractinoplanes brasiliensis]|uniref:NnrS family protein n=1 Tax=Paractinoplanes brasiliensis TaxID=52695 RepID=A0A4V3C7A6_9ACTN|nr:hypothetical protein [Actinoplanes brasiliensis]TDO36848.1 hypothetical protein C8E87_0432 [Actinoplanes brasiliensis]GID30365.1 hypothetical protein Abr02nite_53480 [Actinoplanes brasiliensis]
MSRPAGIAVRWRLPLLAAGAASLLTGLYAGLLLLGARVPAPAVALEQVHGPVMVFGFVGTLIALERAVALGVRWALLAPACSGLGGLVLVATGPTLAGKTLAMAASVVLLGIYRALWRRQPSAGLLAQGCGAFGWYAATLLWLAGYAVAEIVPWMAVFVVATIAGERLEPAHIALRDRNAERWFLVALAAVLGGATAGTLWPAAGAHLFGAGVLAVTAWLAVFDVARRTVRAEGLPRYIAAGLLAGYGWLALAGLLWAGAGPVLGGPRYDATLHALFLGFVMSMIFVHAPVIFPAVLRRPLPYHRALYVPLALLHASLLVRVVLGDAAGLEPVWRVAGVVNVAAVLAFAACAVALCLRRRTPARTAPQAVVALS